MMAVIFPKVSSLPILVMGLFSQAILLLRKLEASAPSPRL